MKKTVNISQLTGIHVLLVRGSGGHNAAQIVFHGDIEKPDEMVHVDLPEPFGCMIAAFLVQCGTLADVANNVPEALRAQLTHETAGQMLASVMGDAFGRMAKRDSEMNSTLH